MAKKAILDVLESTIGKYVKNLDAESLNVAVWSGKIELHSLELNIDAVNKELDRQAAHAPNLAIPFRVTGGSFGSFEVDVPWARITSRPVVLRATGLKVFVEPHDRLAKLDRLASKVNSEQSRIQKSKRDRAKSIKVNDEYRKQSNALRKLVNVDDGSNNLKDERSNDSFGGRLVRRIAENLQVEIEDVHISLIGCDGAAGVVLASLSLVTTDKYGMRTFVDRSLGAMTADSSFLYKALSIKGLGIYLDEVKNDFSRPFTISEKQVVTGTNKGVEHSFILAPLSFEAKLRQCDETKCLDFPKYLLSSQLSQLSILLSRNQLELGEKISRAIISSNHVTPLFPEYRPIVSVRKGTAKEWWIYALRCINRLNGRRSWVEFYLAFQKRRTYIPLYKRAIYSPSCVWLAKLSTTEQVELDLIEEDHSISVEGIMAWRNIADAQADLEQEKHAATRRKDSTTSGLMKNFFGSKGKSASTLEEDSPPISLSVEEMKELESITLEQAADSELSKDARLCDVKFVLGSLKINLSTHTMKPLASLSLGMVTTSFDANVDGSFNFRLKLSSVLIYDTVTVNSLYSTILHNLPSPDGLTAKDDSFVFQLSNSSDGNRNLSIRMVAFEMVASPILVVEMKQFFSLSQRPSNIALSNTNPLLAQSVSGSVDLFYDADDGEKGRPAAHFISDAFMAEQEAATVDKLSSTLLSAWRSKVEAKKQFTIDCDLHAPIIIVPEDCVNRDAVALVFDLGHLQLRLGNIDVPKKVLQWTETNKISMLECQLDPGSLLMENLTFSVCTTKELLSNKDFGNEAHPFQTVVEPLSLKLDFGIETSTGLPVPRICAFGVISSLAMRVSPSQVLSMALVVKKWKGVQDRLGENGKVANANVNVGIPILDDETAFDIRRENTTLSRRVPQGLPVNSTDQTKESTSMVASAMQLYVSVALQKFSVYCQLDKRFSYDDVIPLDQYTAVDISSNSICHNGVEAHLVSVSASSATSFDGNVCINLRMGWFWILDRLKSELPRRQRLLAHSNLPRTAADFAVHNEYDIFGELQKLGVFSDDYVGSYELADISAVVKSSCCKIPPDQIFNVERPFENRAAVDVILDMKFTSLFVNWNPSVLKTIVQVSNEAINMIDDTAQDTAAVIIPVRHSRTKSFVEKLTPSKIQSSLIVTAQLEHFAVSLNSARDDLPLYVFSMSGTRISILSCQKYKQEILADFELGDVRISTPAINSTKLMYRSLLGLAPSYSASLLSVHYFVGRRPLHSAILDQSIDKAKCEAYAAVELSPMRFVYIQAQVLTLVEYINDGILGAITARAAASAANVAVDIVSSEVGEKVFSIKAVGFDLILPEAASSPKHFIVHAGDLSIHHRVFSDPGGSATTLSLSGVSLHDGLTDTMVDKPIKLNVKVDLPPHATGSVECDTIFAAIEISKASFLLTRAQYRQVMHMLDCNIGESDPFLREVFDPKLVNLDATEVQEKASDDTSRHITHAGLAIVENTKKINLDLRIELLSLEICNTDLSDPLAKISAANTRINMKLIPDQDQLKYEIMLHHLICEDRRLKSANRPFRNLISQSHGGQKVESSDVFFVSVSNDKMLHKTDVSLILGAPQVVIVPDAIADILSFLSLEESSIRNLPVSDYLDELPRKDKELELDSDGISMEIAFAVMKETLTLSLVTEDCGIVLVDMGSSSLAEGNIARSLTAKGYQTQVTESIVLQGKFTAHIKTETEVKNKPSSRVDLDLHGSCVEVYTAYGCELSSPLQIVEPTSYSVFFSIHPKPGGATEVELRAVTLEPLEITFSVQNAALCKAISSSLKGSLVESRSLESKRVNVVPLSERETKRIEALASALARTDTTGTEDSFALAPTATDGSSHDSNTNGNKFDLTLTQWKLKMTLPETNITVVNDLQGLDDALFRLSISNLVTGAEGTKYQLQDKPQMTYEFHVNSTLSADYFDSSVNHWKKLLKKPWETTLNSTRGVSKRFRSNRLSTTLDIESFPCHLSFSEQFLVSLNAASKMWAIYSRAISLATGIDIGADDGANHSVAKEALAANAARNLVVSLPYAVENHSGIDAFFTCTGSTTSEKHRKSCPTGTIQYFRFDAPRGTGYGGRRLYGQDAVLLKSLAIHVGNAKIEISHLDEEIGRPRRAHNIGNGRILIAHVTRDSKSTVLHLSSHVEMHNDTSIPFDISVLVGSESFFVGRCGGRSGDTSPWSPERSSLPQREGGVSRKTKKFGIPIHLLDSFQIKSSKQRASAAASLQVSPQLEGSHRPLVGNFNIPSCQTILLSAVNDQSQTIFDVTCRDNLANSDHSERTQDPFVLQVRMNVTIINEANPFIEIFLKPRATIENKTPISLSVRTPMPYTFILSQQKVTSLSRKTSRGERQHEIIHELAPNDGIEIFTPSPSIAIGIKCNDQPVGGGLTGWMKGDWVDLPMVPEFRLPEPLRCMFPFETNRRVGIEGSEFFIIEAGDDLSEAVLEQRAEHLGEMVTKYSQAGNDSNEMLSPTLAGIDTMRRYHVTVCNYGVDHTGGILFEQVVLTDRQLRGSQALDSSVLKRSLAIPTLSPFSAFASTKKQARISLLPGSSVPLRILHLTMDGQDGLRRSLPFRIEDISICSGGINSTPLLWEDNSASGFFAFRRLIGSESFQTEIHIIPEFIIYNGSKSRAVLIRQQGGHGPTTEIYLEPGKTAPIKMFGKSGLVLSLLYVELGGVTPWMRMDDLSHKVVIIRSMDNFPLGSLACQTVIGSTDSRLVIKLGDIQFGSGSREMVDETSLPSNPFADDFLRIRVRWSELRVTLNEPTLTDNGRKGSGSAIVESALDHILAKKGNVSKESPFTLKKGSPSPKKTWVEARRDLNLGLSSEGEAIEDYSQAPVCTLVFHRFTIDWQKNLQRVEYSYWR